MTNEEAIKIIEKDALYNPECAEICKTALKKQIPAKPLPYKGFDGQCPDCKVIFLDRATNYCGNCGKKIDWEEE